MNLTDKQVQHLVKPGRYNAGITGLHLRVVSKEKKYWVLRYSLGNKRHDYGLGKYPDLKLAEARFKAVEANKLLSEGIDPITHKNKRLDAIKQECEKPLFKAFAIECVNKKKGEWRNKKHGDQWISTLNEYVFPLIGNKHLDEITTKDVLKILNPIWTTKTHTAQRVRGRVEWILGSATTQGLRDGINPALWRGHLITVLPSPQKIAKTKHHAALPYQQIFEFMSELREMDHVSALALEFTILTATRTAETLGAKRSEIIDNIWTIPADRMKANKEQRIPLVQRALDIIEIAKSRDPNSEYIFSHNNKKYSNMAMLVLTRRMGYKITVHGFRSTFRTWTEEETTHPESVAKKALAHTIKDKVDEAYNRGDLLKKRMVMMDDWASFCSKPYKNNVLQLKTA